MLNRLLAGLRALFSRHREEQDLDDELRAYLEAAVEQHVRAGMSRDEAVRAARMDIGSVEGVKDAVRDAGWESRVESVWQDVRYAVRGLRRSPGFATVVILTLALGIGANTAIFSVVNGLLLRALPVAEPERLAIVSTRSAIEQGFPAGWSFGTWEEIRRRQDAFGKAVAWTVFPQRFDLSSGGEAEPADGLFVSANFFQELGVSPIVGRTFATAEDTLGSPDTRVAVISHGFWQRRFGGDADIVGRQIAIARVPVTIVGVAPPAFLGPEVGRSFEIAMPLGSAPLILNDPTWGTPAGRAYLAVMFRLRTGQSSDSATAGLRALQRQIIRAAMPPDVIWGEYHDGLLNNAFALTPAAAGTSELRRQYSRPLITVLVIAAMVLLIACTNVASLMLARATAGHRESSLRLALGAPRWRLMQATLLEGLVLSGMGATLGLGLAVWGSRALVAQLSTWFDRVVLDVSVDWSVLAFTVAVTVATAALFGTVPAITASRAIPAAAMKQPGSTPGRGGAARTPGAFVLVQVAVSMVLLVAAGLLIRTFDQLGAVPLGFDSAQVLVADANVSRAAPEAAGRPALYQRLVAAIEAIPGVTHAAASLNTPLNRGVTLVADFTVPGGPEPAERRVVVNYVTPGWFETYGSTLRSGRVIEERDSASAPPVVVGNDAFARRFFPDRPALGAAIADALVPPGMRARTMTVIGVVGNAVDQSLRAEAYPAIYQPFAQWPPHGPQVPPEIALSIHAGAGSPALLARSVAARLTSLDRNLTFSFHVLADQVGAGRQQERLVAALSGVFALLALLLVAVGLYGITSYAVARRRTEIGIRMALGARRHDVVNLTVGRAALLTAAGVAVGLSAAAVLTRYLESLLFGITPLDPSTFVVTPVLLFAVAVLAALLPARQAATVDPMTTLHSE